MENDPTASKAAPSPQEAAFNAHAEAAAPKAGSPSPSAPGAAAPANGAAAPEGTFQSARLKALLETGMDESMLDRLVIQAIDQLILARAGNVAAKCGLEVSPEDEKELRLTDVEKQELRDNLPSVLPFVMKYAKYFQYFGLALFGLSIWRMSNTRVRAIYMEAHRQRKAERQERRYRGSRDDDPDEDDAGDRVP